MWVELALPQLENQTPVFRVTDGDIVYTILTRSCYLRQWCSGSRALCGHCENCSDAQANTGRGGIHVDPEGDPRQDNC